MDYDEAVQLVRHAISEKVIPYFAAHENDDETRQQVAAMVYEVLDEADLLTEVKCDHNNNPIVEAEARMLTFEVLFYDFEHRKIFKIWPDTRPLPEAN